MNSQLFCELRKNEVSKTILKLKRKIFDDKINEYFQNKNIKRK